MVQKQIFGINGLSNLFLKLSMLPDVIAEIVHLANSTESNVGNHETSLFASLPDWSLMGRRIQNATHIIVAAIRISRKIGLQLQIGTVEILLAKVGWLEGVPTVP